MAGNRTKVATKRKSAASPRPARNAEQTRMRILEVARLEFAEKGYNGARVDEIVERCSVSKNLIYHYFTSKEALFIAVMELTYRLMRERQSEWSFIDLPPQEAIEKLILLTFDHFLDDPTVISLLNTENLHQAKHIKQSNSIQPLYNPLVDAITRITDKGRAQGVFRKNIDPIDLYITISGLSYFYISNNYTLSYLFKQDLMEPKRILQRKKHVVEVVLSYLCL